MSGLAPGSLAPHVLENGIGGLVGELEAAAQIDELRRNAGVDDAAVSVTDGGLGWGRLVWDGLLRRTVLVGGNVLASGGFKGKLEDLEGVGVFGSGSCDTEGVPGREGNLCKMSGLPRELLGSVTYLVGGEADLVVHGNLKQGVGVLHLHH